MFQRLGRDVIDDAVDEDGRDVGLSLGVASELGQRLRLIGLIEGDSRVLFLDRMPDDRASVRWQVIVSLVALSPYASRLFNYRIRKREDLFFRAFSEHVQRQLALIVSSNESETHEPV